jgi:hypothetical protein
MAQLVWRSVSRSESKLVPLGYMPGFSLGSLEDRDSRSGKSEKEVRDLKFQGAMAFARSPIGQVFMTGLMLYFSGNSIQIFSMMTLAMAFWNPSKAILSLNQAFEKFEHPKLSLVLPKIVYVICNLALVGVAVYKCTSMGLLGAQSRPPQVSVEVLERSNAFII